MKLKRFFAVALSFALLLSGCSSSVSGSLFYDIPAAIASYDPQIAESGSALLMSGNCFEGLLRRGADGELLPAAALRWDISEDGLTYRFYLRGGMLWSDGETPLTAEDFLFGFRRLFDPDTDAPFRSDFYAIANSEMASSKQMSVNQIGVSAPDSRTLEITLSYADPFFLELLTTPAASPCNEAFFLSTRGRYGSSTEYTLFNGPYGVSRIKEDVYYRLSRNAAYYGFASAYSNVYLYIQSAADYSASARLLGGDIDAAPVRYSDVPALSEAGFRTDGYQDTVWVLLFNTARGPLSNQSIRRAVFYACDRTGMEAMLPDNLTVAHAFVPPAVTISGESYRALAGESFSGFDYDPAAAAALLAEGLAQLGADRLETLTIACPEEYLPLMGLLQRSIQKDLAAFVNLLPVSDEELGAALSSGDFDILLTPVTVKYNTPSAFFSVFSSAENPSGFYSERLISTVQAAADSLTLDGMVDGYATAEQLLLQYMPVCPMFFETSYFACSGAVSNLSYSPFGGHVAFYYAD